MLMRAWRHPVTRSDRLGAYARYLSWKLHASVVSGPVLVPFVNETLLLAEPLSRETRELSLLVLKDPEAMAFIAHFLRGDEHFVDVGASIGSYAVLAAATADACVTAFEPEPGRAALLRRNVALNGLGGRVDCRELAVAEVPGELKAFWSSTRRLPLPLRVATRECASAAVVRLDDARLAGHPVLARVDVGGDELAVLRGANATLGDPSLCAVIVGADPERALEDEQPELVRAVLERHGFVPADYDPWRRRLLRLERTRRTMIYVRQRRAEHIVRRLAEAAGIRVDANLCL